MGDLEIAAVGKLRSNNFFGSKNTLGKAFLPVTSHAVAHTRTNGRERERLEFGCDRRGGTDDDVTPSCLCGDHHPIVSFLVN